MQMMSRKSDLLNPTLTALHALGGSASKREIANQVIEDMGLSAAITQVPHGQRSMTELEDRLQWARTYLKNYGLIDNSERGVWSLTAKGRETQRVDSPKKLLIFIGVRKRTEAISQTSQN